MFISILFAFSLCSERKICICNSKCSSSCPSETFIGTSFNSSLYSTLKTSEKETLEFDFYSGEEIFHFEVDLTFFKMKQIKLKFKTLTDSKSVTLTLKNNESESREQAIIIKPNDEIYFLENYEFYSPIKKFTKNHQSKLIKNNQVSSFYQQLTTIKADDNYSYLNQHKIPTSSFNYSSLGDQNNNPIRNAFDGNTHSYWVSSIVTTTTVKDQIAINFFNLTCIESIVYYITYTTNRSVTPIFRYYLGFPLKLNIYTSSYDDDFELSFTFSGTPDPYELWTSALFKFHQPIWCDKLILEFVEVSYDFIFGKNYTASCGEISFIPPDVLVPTKSSIPSISPVLPTKEEEEIDDSLHFTSSIEKVNSKPKKKSSINKSTIVIIVIGVEMVAIIGIIIVMLIIIIRHQKLLFRNHENNL